MSTTYRVVVTCDEQKSDRCLGLLELSGDRPEVCDRVVLVPERAGWLRGYGGAQTYDVCPACRAVVEQTRALLGATVRAAPPRGSA